MPYIPERRPPEPEVVPEEPERKKPEEQSLALRRLWPVLLYLSAVLVIYGAVKLIGYGAEYVSARKTGQELQHIYRETEPAAEEPTPETEETISPALSPVVTGTPAATNTPAPEKGKSDKLQPMAYPDNPGLKVSERFIRLRKKSGYIIGWLSMDGVDEAVVLKDNSFFLNHDASGKRNSNGAIFLDEWTDLLSRPYTICLYGHNMKSGHMFGRLKKYLDRAYYTQHRFVDFDSLYEEGKYVVFAAAEFSTVPGTATYFDLWAMNSESRKIRETAIRRLISMTPYDSVLDVREDEQILLLVTCIDTDTDRLVVAARRMREGESEDKLAIRRK